MDFRRRVLGGRVFEEANPKSKSKFWLFEQSVNSFSSVSYMVPFFKIRVFM